MSFEARTPMRRPNPVAQRTGRSRRHRRYMAWILAVCRERVMGTKWIRRVLSHDEQRGYRALMARSPMRYPRALAITSG
jgi:hypothetical protein